MRLEEINTNFTGTAAILQNYKKLLMSAAAAPLFGDEKADELFSTVWNIFPAARDVILDGKFFALRSDFDIVTVFIIDSSEECRYLIEDAEMYFENHPEDDEFVQRNKFACEISLEQFAELAGDDFNDSEGFIVDEFGQITFSFDDTEPVFKAHADGKI